MLMRANIVAIGLILVGCTAATQVSAQYSSGAGGRILVYTPPASGAEPNYANAKPVPLPRPATKPAAKPTDLASPLQGKPGTVAGGRGDGKESPTSVPAQKNSGVGSEDAGPTCGIVCQFPFTTNRVDAYFTTTTKFYPFRAAGKLFFNIGEGSFVCSASLIAPGLVVTAGHCVAGWGTGHFHSNWVFVPAYSNGLAPYGKWSAQQAAVMSSYIFGTDSCSQAGVVCDDDVAVILLRPTSKGDVPGNHTGWFGYGWNGYGFFHPNESPGQTEITQLGYPCNLDSCALMERTDSQGFTDPNSTNNTIIGSEQEGGSSGGPWVINLGQPPSGLQGSDLARDIVVGVTSWGFIDTTVMEQGASPFTSGNIVPLYNFFCPNSPQC
jgi:hypothetical protein